MTRGRSQKRLDRSVHYAKEQKSSSPSLAMRNAFLGCGLRRMGLLLFAILMGSERASERAGGRKGGRERGGNLRKAGISTESLHVELLNSSESKLELMMRARAGGRHIMPPNSRSHRGRMYARWAACLPGCRGRRARPRSLRTNKSTVTHSQVFTWAPSLPLPVSPSRLIISRVAYAKQSATVHARD